MEVAVWLASEIEDRSPEVLEEFRPAVRRAGYRLVSLLNNRWVYGGAG